MNERLAKLQALLVQPKLKTIWYNISVKSQLLQPSCRSN